jgi:predicted O-methyltransferase YrrM
VHSVEAAKLIPDGSLDFVFIDALHTYEAVLEDLAAWHPKVRRDGIVAGHDYRWDGVQKAVHEFFEARNISGFFTPPTSDVWFYAKSV